MAFVENIFVVLHLLGMAALVGGWLVFVLGGASAATRQVIVWGARAQVITGVIIVGLLEMGAADEPPNHSKIGVKFLIAVAAAACAEIGAARDKRGESSRQLLTGAGVLGVLNVAVAALWG